MGALDRAGANEHAVLAVPTVAHAVSMCFEVLDELAQGLACVTTAAFDLAESLEHVGDVTSLEVLEQSVDPGAAFPAWSSVLVDALE